MIHTGSVPGWAVRVMTSAGSWNPGPGTALAVPARWLAAGVDLQADARCPFARSRYEEEAWATATSWHFSALARMAAISCSESVRTAFRGHRRTGHLGELLGLLEPGLGGSLGFRADVRSIHHNGPHTDNYVILDQRAVDYGSMPTLTPEPIWTGTAGSLGRTQLSWIFVLDPTLMRSPSAQTP
jgi:hypothetical protein